MLTNGFRIHADRHEMDSGVVRLYTGDSTSEFPGSAVLAFEQDDYVAPPPPAATETVPAPAPSLQLSWDPRTW